VIGQREALGLKPLSPKTMARIRRSFERIEAGQVFGLDRLNDVKGKIGRPIWLPLPTITSQQTFGVMFPPETWQIVFRNHDQPRDVSQHPSPAICASGGHMGIVVTPDEASRNMLVTVASNTFERESSGYARAWSVDEPMTTVHGTLDRGILQTPDANDVRPVLRGGENFVVANYSPGHVRDVTLEPMGTLTGKDRHGLAAREPRPKRDYDIEDCRFRMFSPEESQRGMSMDRRLIPLEDGSYEEIPYTLIGSGRDRVCLAGNGVTPQVEAAITDRCLIAMGR
jgi:hypothetical protein